jgi:hypothetical protein
MYSLSAYGLTIRSPISFPELTPAEPGGPPDVTLTVGRVEPVGPPAIVEPGLTFWARPGEATLSYEGVGTYHVVGGRQVTVDPSPGADEREIRFFALGPAMAMLLHQRDLLPLHANAVCVDGVAVLFMGFSGRGKSTTAAALCARGHPLIADDIAPVRMTPDGPVVLPGWSHMRLLPQSLAIVGADRPAGPTIHPRTDKYAWHAARFADGPVPLGRIYLITDDDRIAIEPLPRNEAFGQLVAGTYPVPARLMEADGGTASHFRRCVAVAARTTVARLKRPRALDLLPALCRAIEEDVGATAAARAAV